MNKFQLLEKEVCANLGILQISGTKLEDSFPFRKRIEILDKVYSNKRVSTRVNTSQHQSTQVLHDTTRINTSAKQVNTNQHESKTILDHKK